MAVSWGLFNLTFPNSAYNQYLCGVPYTYRWSYQIWEGSDADLDARNERIWFRIYNSIHPEYPGIIIGPILVSKKSYTLLNGAVTPGSGWDLLAYYHGSTAPTEAQWAAESKLQLVLVAPPPPNKPVFSAPAPGTEVYTNAAINIEWLYSDPKGVSQSKRELIAVSDDGETLALTSGISSEEKYTIPANRFALPSGVRRRFYSLYVSVANWANPTFTKSDALRIGILATSPEKPVPTKPGDDTISYPLAALDVEFPYTAHGGYGLSQVLFEYYKAGETAWGRSLTFDTATPAFTVPAGTFSIGAWSWRIKAKNSNNEWSPASDAFDLTMIASAPLAPNLTAPAAGSSQYNHAPVAYGWDYLNNAQVAQGAAQLQYKLDGAASWTTVDIAGSVEIYLVSHAGANGTMLWRVRTKNTLNEWSPWSATGSYALATPLPVATPNAPLNVYVDPDAACAFSWVASSPIGTAIAAYELQWKTVSAGTWNALTGTTATSRVIAGGTLPENTLLWRVRVTDADGRTGNWSENVQFVTLDVAPSAPTLSYPVDVYLPVSEAVRFQWIHNNVLGTLQGSAEVRYKLGTGDWTTEAVADGAAALQLTAFELSVGGYAWQVRTFNRDGVAGTWSETRYFSVTGAAVTPGITEAAANGARPSVSWSAEGQVVYEVQVWQFGVMIDRNVSVAEGDSGSYRAAVFVAPGPVTLMVRNQNMYGFWSGWAQAAVNALAGTGDAPILTAAQAPNRLAIHVGIAFDWGDGHAVYLYRDGAVIAQMGVDGYLDFCAKSGVAHAYMSRAVLDDGTYLDSAAVTATLSMPCATIAPADAPGDCILIRMGQDGPPEYARQLDTASEQVVVSGRALPVTEHSEHRSAAYGIRCALSRADVDRLNAMKLSRKTVLYRDAYGRRDYCRIASVADYGAAIGGGKTYVAASIGLDATDYDETITIE